MAQFADIVGIALLKEPREGLTSDEMLENVLDAITPYLTGRAYGSVGLPPGVACGD